MLVGVQASALWNRKSPRRRSCTLIVIITSCFKEALLRESAANESNELLCQANEETMWEELQQDTQSEKHVQLLEELFWCLQLSCLGCPLLPSSGRMGKLAALEYQPFRIEQHSERTVDFNPPNLFVWGQTCELKPPLPKSEEKTQRVQNLFNGHSVQLKHGFESGHHCISGSTCNRSAKAAKCEYMQYECKRT